MNKLFMARQEIFDRSSKFVAYELLFRDSIHGIRKFPSNLKATSNVIINTLTNVNTDELLGVNGIAFVNVDEEVLLSNILDILDKERFILEILETTELTEEVVSKIKKYSTQGFTIAIDDFDCSAEMIIKFTPLLKYIDIIKIDVLNSEPENLKNVVAKLKKSKIKLLAEKIETKEIYDECIDYGFDMFQGYHLSKPEVLEVERYKESTKMVILQLIKIIKDAGETSEIELYVKKHADLSYKLLKFLNNKNKTKFKIESITQVITMLGRDALLKWLMVYLYSEVSTNPASKTVLQMAIKRAERMASDASSIDKDKAYLAGMFSLLDVILEANIKDLMQDMNMDKEINSLVIDRKGKFAESFFKAEKIEREYLQTLMNDNFDKINTQDLIYTIDINGITIDRNQL